MDKATVNVITAMMLVAGADEFGLLDKLEEHFEDRDGEKILSDLEGFLRDKVLPKGIEQMTPKEQVESLTKAEEMLNEIIVTTAITALEQAIKDMEGYGK